MVAAFTRLVPPAGLSVFLAPVYSDMTEHRLASHAPAPALAVAPHHLFNAHAQWASRKCLNAGVAESYRPAWAGPMQGPSDKDERSLHGITFDPKRRNWKARIHYAGKEHYIGRYSSADEAAKAYDQAARMINDIQDDGNSQPKPRRRPLNFPDVHQHDEELHSRLQPLFGSAAAAAASDDTSDGPAGSGPAAAAAAAGSGAQGPAARQQLSRDTAGTPTGSAGGRGSPSGSSAAAGGGGPAAAAAAADTGPGRSSSNQQQALYPGPSPEQRQDSGGSGPIGPTPPTDPYATSQAGTKRYMDSGPKQPVKRPSLGRAGSAPPMPASELSAPGGIGPHGHDIHKHTAAMWQGGPGPASTQGPAAAAAGALSDVPATGGPPAAAAAAPHLSRYGSAPLEESWSGGLHPSAPLDQPQSSTGYLAVPSEGLKFELLEPPQQYLRTPFAHSGPVGGPGAAAGSAGAAVGPWLISHGPPPPPQQLQYLPPGQQLQPRQGQQQPAELQLQQQYPQQLQYPSHQVHQRPSLQQQGPMYQQHQDQHQYYQQGHHQQHSQQQHWQHHQQQQQQHQQHQQQLQLQQRQQQQQQQQHRLWHQDDLSHLGQLDQDPFLDNDKFDSLIDIIGQTGDQQGSRPPLQPRREAAGPQAGSFSSGAPPDRHQSRQQQQQQQQQQPPYPQQPLQLQPASEQQQQLLQPPQLLPLPQCLPFMQQQMAGPHTGRSSPEPAAAAAAAGAGGLLSAVVGRDELMSVANSCLHTLLDMRLAVLTLPEQHSSLAAMQLFLVGQRQQAQQQLLQQTGMPSTAPPGGASQSGASAASQVALLLLEQLLMLLTEAVSGQGLSAAAERSFVLGALNQLQQALSGLQRITAAAPSTGFNRRSCIMEWLAANLCLPAHTPVNPAVGQLAEMM